MTMKKSIALILMLCLLLAGCGEKAQLAVTTETATETTAAAEPTQTKNIVYPLPDTTMENITDTVLSVSLEEGKAYVDDTGKMQMDVTVYTYDKYDMVDISMLKAGDTLVTHSGEVEILAVEQDPSGTVRINGGLDEGGMDLVTDDSGIFYETGYNDHKSWYEIGYATIRVSVDFIFTDNADLEQGEVIYYPGSFLIGEVTNYDFTPYNTTIRIAEGQIVEMNRVYTP